MLMTRTVHCAVAIFLSAGFCFANDADVLPQPGPEVAGLRLRFLVETRRTDSGDEFQVRLDLINVTDSPVRLSADWPNHLKGDFREYMEGAASMRTHPDITLWGIQVMSIRQPAPRAEHILAAGGTLSVEWTSKGRLKNRVINPNSNRNPSFPSDGLYGVHAELLLNVETEPVDTKREVSPSDEGEIIRRPVLLRSNEQLVSVGGSNRAPKTAIAIVQNVSDDLRSGQISVGSIDGIEPGDGFLARTGMGVFWKLTVTESHAGFSRVSVEPFVIRPGQPVKPREH